MTLILYTQVRILSSLRPFVHLVFTTFYAKINPMRKQERRSYKTAPVQHIMVSLAENARVITQGSQARPPDRLSAIHGMR